MACLFRYETSETRDGGCGCPTSVLKLSPQILRGLVYLFLILAGGAALWIFILYLILGRARRRIVELDTENRKLKRQLEDVKVRIETRDMDDEELLKDVTDLLAHL